MFPGSSPLTQLLQVSFVSAPILFADLNKGATFYCTFFFLHLSLSFEILLSVCWPPFLLRKKPETDIESILSQWQLWLNCVSFELRIALRAVYEWTFCKVFPIFFDLTTHFGDSWTDKKDTPFCISVRKEPSINPNSSIKFPTSFGQSDLYTTSVCRWSCRLSNTGTVGTRHLPFISLKWALTPESFSNWVHIIAGRELLLLLYIKERVREPSSIFCAR